MPSRDEYAADFEAQRPRLLRLGYRMLGSVSEAEDIVQEAWLRWAAKAESVDAPAAYLTRIVTRLCLDQLKSARVRRETYVGAWLPEPLMETTEPDETIADDLTLTLMLAMERLSPLERAAFLLHDVFGVALTDIAATLGREPAAVRQLAARARKHVQDARPRFPVDAREADRIARAFFTASREGDAGALSALLARDVAIYSDGGGKVIAFRNIVRGIDRALRLFAGLKRKNTSMPTLLRTAMIDGLPGYVSVDRGDVLQTTALDVRDGRIAAIYIVRNPDKLRHLAAAFDTSSG
ncbi:MULTISPECIES: sigma-70 family RNA polymerase sigma factor [unclassified Novosphingobium]|uniref:sigma-70 family RNA polymerase sigma factor n=1 Tax=unclassified Novosphingobium TaxID=2644732 RepID=UPI000F5E32B6|nr:MULTISPECIES: sigma-70 family RNA polymerase sigma factor [unclassified Novosphingobium]MBF5092687.1 sigma-70 family RNA polymerase sigma factor [Novosphingobium sp. NBM11]RQW45036.1 sigma-70 family RNA polymerase sigma factor [Novosphingobium sp. LASN5T]